MEILIRVSKCYTQCKATAISPYTVPSYNPNMMSLLARVLFFLKVIIHIVNQPVYWRQERGWGEKTGSVDVASMCTGKAGEIGEAAESESSGATTI